MLKKIITILSCSCFAAITTHANEQTTYQQFIPKHWKIIKTVKGDLNRDGKSDVVLLVEENNTRNMIKNDGLGSPTLNVNPRQLLVLFKTKQGYQLVSKNDNFPTESDPESPCLADPLEDGGITINKGILKVSLHYWLSCGSWYVTSKQYQFRYQNNQFKLIGFDQSSFHRASGDEHAQSINFLTGKVKNTDSNEFEESKQPTQVTWQKLSRSYNLNLSEINFKEPPEFK